MKAGTTMCMQAISSSSFFGIWLSDPVLPTICRMKSSQFETGRMVNQFGTLNQSLAVTNNGGTQHKFVSLECGFYLK